jgi:hypothetical protein
MKDSFADALSAQFCRKISHRKSKKTTLTMFMLCPLCHSEVSQKLAHQQVPSDIFHCQTCDLIFKSSAIHLNWDEQKLRYDLHQNHIDNPGYVEFFEQLMKPLQPYLEAGRSALDWGSGPGEEPVLALLLRRENLQVDLYDPIYQPQFKQSLYDVITSTEALEHFQNPGDSLNDILSHLKSGGVFAGLTQFHQGPEKLRNWWYVKDPTHVVFYSETTFRWIAQKWNLEILELKSPVFIFRKKEEVHTSLKS